MLMNSSVYPDELPMRLKTYCELNSQFFVDALGTRMMKQEFMIYLEALLHRAPSNPYEHLFLAALHQDLPTVSVLSKTLKVAQYPMLTQCLSTLMKRGNPPHDDLLLQLLFAPLSLSNNTLPLEIFELIYEEFPEHQERLLRLAFLNDYSIHWNRILDQKLHGGLACLALSKNGQDTRHAISNLYDSNKSLQNLSCWSLLDAEAALKVLQHHPSPEEVIKLLVLHGNAPLLLEQVHKLATIEYPAVMRALSLFFNTQIRTRPGLSDHAWDLFEVADPVFVKRLLETRFTEKHPYLRGVKRTDSTITELTASCTGKAVEFFQLYQKLHALGNSAKSLDYFH
jgi:hypothetical protein